MAFGGNVGKVKYQKIRVIQGRWRFPATGGQRF
jgi:hypothetical protein